MTQAGQPPAVPVAAALAEAAASAGYAPSVHNTQPWRWRVEADRLELRADRERQLRATDPQGRMLVVSCGTALHHARVALAAQGWVVEVARVPEPGDPDLLAVLTLTGRAPVTAGAMRLVQAARLRHTDRRPVSETPVPPEALTAIRAAVEAEGIGLHVLSADQLGDLAAAAGRASEVEAADPAIAEEMAYWTGHSPEGTGLPASALPASPPQVTVPGREFGHPGTLAIGPGHDRAARYAVLFGPDDEPPTWLRAGEALSASWLTATELGVAMLPLSGAIEVPLTRAALRRLLSGIGQPYLVLRLGTADPEHAGPPHTPRMPAAQVVDTSAVRGERG
jgi:nitroreductase